MFSKLIELYRFREVLFNFASQELKVKYKKSVLGFLWSLLNPVLTISVSSMVFAAIMRFELNNFVVFIYSGLLPWGFLSLTIDGSPNALINSEAFIKKVYIPKLIFPLAGVLSNFINMILSMLSLFILLLFIGLKVTPALLFLPFSFIIAFIAASGISFILSTVTVFFRDIRHMVGVVTSAFFYLTPILYPLEHIPAKYAWIIKFNPFYYIVQLFRYPLYYGYFPSLKILVISISVSLLLAIVGYVIFTKNEKNFVYRL
ncbi:ABC transporter permease [Paenibacillus cymbidii]|uniref:ABC transporter permease n=1 Tax=Paenibacillus cymbidii TaxID=1639034 RepID=UPI0010809AE9|nr:ABC transporter permease [Paenibacillus cymbidii]